MLLLLLAALLSVTRASHLAYGTVNWKRLADPWQFEVSVDLSFRTSFFTSNGKTVEVGKTFVPGVDYDPLISIGYQPENCAQPACGSACYWADEIPSTVTQYVRTERPPRICAHATATLRYEQKNWDTPFTVLVVYPNDDYFTCRAKQIITLPLYQIGGWNSRESRWWFFVHAFARVSSLNSVSMVDGNGGGMLSFQTSTILDPNYAFSPVAIGLARETAAVGSPWKFDMSKQAFSPNLLPLTFELPPTRPALSTVCPLGPCRSGSTGFGCQRTSDLYCQDTRSSTGRCNSEYVHCLYDEYPKSPTSMLINTHPGTVETGPAIDFTTDDFANTGVMTWTPSVEGFYAFQVWIRDSNGMVAPLDFIIHVITLC